LSTEPGVLSEKLLDGSILDRLLCVSIAGQEASFELNPIMSVVSG
jgi:hypothetical protein